MPHSSSAKFAKALQDAGAKAFLYEYPHQCVSGWTYGSKKRFDLIVSRYKGLGHSHMLFDLMDNVQSSPVLRDVVKIVKQSKTSYINATWEGIGSLNNLMGNHVHYHLQQLPEYPTNN